MDAKVLVTKVLEKVDDNTFWVEIDLRKYTYKGQLSKRLLVKTNKNSLYIPQANDALELKKVGRNFYIQEGTGTGKVEEQFYIRSVSHDIEWNSSKGRTYLLREIPAFVETEFFELKITGVYYGNKYIPILNDFVHLTPDFEGIVHSIYARQTDGKTICIADLPLYSEAEVLLSDLNKSLKVFKILKDV